MKSPWIESLRSVTLTVPDLGAAERFYTDTWRLSVAAREGDRLYLRGSGEDHHLLALHEAGGRHGVAPRRLVEHAVDRDRERRLAGRDPPAG